MMTACWSKSKSGKKHPYYMCFQKGCEDYRKSIRRADIEGAFEEMLESLTPAPALLKAVTAMFKDAWAQQAHRAKAGLKDIRASITKIDNEISGLLDRIVSASNERVIGAYESKIDKLEKDKLVLQEKLTKKPKSQRPFDEVFELCLKFLQRPINIWKSGRPEDQKTVLRLVFSEALRWKRNEGFRTPETSSVFGAIRDISGR
jgi:hypothetical protein